MYLDVKNDFLYIKQCVYSIADQCVLFDLGI